MSVLLPSLLLPHLKFGIPCGGFAGAGVRPRECGGLSGMPNFFVVFVLPLKLFNFMRWICRCCCTTHECEGHSEMPDLLSSLLPSRLKFEMSCPDNVEAILKCQFCCRLCSNPAKFFEFHAVDLQVLVYDPDNVEAILARCKASRAAGRKVEALAHLESGRKQAL